MFKTKRLTTKQTILFPVRMDRVLKFQLCLNIHSTNFNANTSMMKKDTRCPTSLSSACRRPFEISTIVIRHPLCGVHQTKLQSGYASKIQRAMVSVSAAPWELSTTVLLAIRMEKTIRAHLSKAGRNSELHALIFTGTEAAGRFLASARVWRAGTNTGSRPSRRSRVRTGLRKGGLVGVRDGS